MGMGDQIKYQRSFMDWRAKKKAAGGATDKPAAGGAAKKEEAGGFEELAKEVLLKMSMPEQLQY